VSVRVLVCLADVLAEVGMDGSERRSKGVGRSPLFLKRAPNQCSDYQSWPVA